MRKLLEELCEAIGLPGWEEQVSSVVKRWLEPCVDEVYLDKQGNLIAWKKGLKDAPKIMLAAHMDEVGMIVKHVEFGGHLRFEVMGRIDPRVLPGQKVLCHTEKGTIWGVIGSKPPHIQREEEKKKVYSITDLYVDIGVDSREEAFDMGVVEGSMISFPPFFVEQGDKYLGKGFDDRVGLAVMVETLRRLKNGQHPNTVCAVGTVQEEVGARGAGVAAHQVKPDFALILESTAAADTPGVAEHESPTKLGGGPALTIVDRSVIVNGKLLKHIKKVARENRIPFQYKKPIYGGTDAGRIQQVGRGVPCAVISVPTRYIHSPVSMVKKEDLERCINLLTRILETTDRDVTSVQV